MGNTGSLMLDNAVQFSPFGSWETLLQAIKRFLIDCRHQMQSNRARQTQIRQQFSEAINTRIKSVQPIRRAEKLPWGRVSHIKRTGYPWGILNKKLKCTKMLCGRGMNFFTLKGLNSSEQHIGTDQNYSQR